MKRTLFVLAALSLSVLQARADHDDGVPDNLNEKTVVQLQQMMASGRLTSVDLTNYYLTRIQRLDQNGPGVNALIELNPDALALAKKADEERRRGIVRGPLHGLPVLLKDNIDTGDKMQTTAGSFALAGQPAVRDSTVAANLRTGGAVILGKTNLSEWANFRGWNSVSGWSGRGGQTNNPYGINRNPCGSSSGSGAAASANFTAVSFGSETDGSIVCPGNANGVVAIKPTVGLTSRAGVVPISHTQDTVGPHARTVADAAAALSVAQSRTFDGRDAATGGVPLGWRHTGKARPAIPADYTQFLDPNGLKGKRIGVTRQGIDNGVIAAGGGQEMVDSFDAAIAAMAAAGATIVPIDDSAFTPAGGELLVLFYDFKHDLKDYFATRVGVPMAGKTIVDAIAFNNAHANVEMPFFGQELFEATADVQEGPDTPQGLLGPPALDLDFGGLTYNQALDLDEAAGVSLDKILSDNNLDAIVAPTDGAAWATDLVLGDRFTFGSSQLAAGPGYPIVQVPSGNVFGAPLGISFFGTAFSEPTLIKLASGFEAVTQARAQNLPTFSATVPFTNIAGVPVKTPHRRGPPPKKSADRRYPRPPRHL
ncbi:MAG TPA: amidase [Myxococcales bacterium]|nr:amidase [Myxococcales bacterium]